MTNFVHLPAALLERLLISGVSDVHQHRGNELHLRITDAAVQPLAELLRADFGAELALMVANDRRADRGVFEVHLPLRQRCRKLVRPRRLGRCPADADPAFAGDLLSAGCAASSVKSVTCSASSPWAIPIRGRW